MAALGNLLHDLHNEVHMYLQQEDLMIPSLLSHVESAAGVTRENIVYGLTVGVAIYLMLGFGAELLCNTIGFAYPVYATYEVIELQSDDDVHWLTYWTVFATIRLVDFASDKILGVFPIYWLVKCLFLMWLYLPYFRGAERLYINAIGPMYKRLRPIFIRAHDQTQAQL